MKTMKNLFWRIVRYFDLYSEHRQARTTQEIISEQLRREGIDKKEN